MGSEQQGRFIGVFSTVVGVLACIAIIAYLVVSAVFAPSETGTRNKAQVAQRTQPVFRVHGDPQQSQHQTAQKHAQHEKSGTQAVGKQVYDDVCAACHRAGVAGASKITDGARWHALLQTVGKQSLYRRAVNGFRAMPPRGGKSSLSDAQVKKAVDYMLAQSGAADQG